MEDREGVAFPDTLVGTDSHTTMINGLGVLGWGVGGIEAEAAMLGEAISMLVPQVVGFKLMGSLPEGATATDLVLTVTQILRQTGVVGKFVEYYGHGLEGLPVADRATLGNMSPEYGATCGFFPVDAETILYLRLTGRPEERVALVEAYCKENGLWHDPDEPPTYSQVVELDLSTVEPSLAGPRRPQDRVPLSEAKNAFLHELPTFGIDYGTAHDEAIAESFPASDPPAQMEPGTETFDGGAVVQVAPTAVAEMPGGATVTLDGETFELEHGSVVIAAITSCTNTSNPAVMVGAGLLAKKAVERGLERKPWVKSSLAPGSKVVTEYYDKAGLTPYLEALGFHTVGYGCTTCIGNSGPLPEPISQAVTEGDLVVCAVLSGNRNFEARIHGEVKANYLASPPLVVAYALAGRMDLDLLTEPLGVGSDGEDVFLSDVWPTPEEVRETVAGSIGEEMFREIYADVFTGNQTWRELPVPEGELFAWDPDSTYVRLPTYFDGMPAEPVPVEDVVGARCLVSVGDSVTTDHISPAGSIKPDSPAGRYLIEHGVERREFNSYGSRRGNHEVMVRGTFANVRLRNLLVPGSEGTWTVHLPSGDEGTIFETAERYRAEGVPLDRARREGVRLRLVARLGGEGAEAARGARGHRRELRADPPLEPADDGNPPAPVPSRREPLLARSDRTRGVRDHRRRERRGARGDGAGGREGVPRDRAAGHPARARVPAPRRDPPVRAARACSDPELGRQLTRVDDDERRRRPRQRDVELAQPLPSTRFLDDQRRLDHDHVVELHALRLPRREHGDPRVVEEEPGPLLCRRAATAAR